MLQLGAILIVALLAVNVVSQERSASVVFNIDATGSGNATPGTSTVAISTSTSTPQTQTRNDIFAEEITPGNQKIVGKVLFKANKPLPTSQQFRYVPTHFHIVTYNGQGMFAASNQAMVQTVRRQIRKLNSAFRPTQTKFFLTTVTYTTGMQSWFNAAIKTQAEVDMKKALRKGNGCKHFNVYSLNPRNPQVGAVAGWATQANDCQVLPFYDGAVISYTVVPGGSNPDYREGETLVHEAGHWADLLDKANCAPPFVDTCAQTTSNYMDCTPDVCRRRFDAGQIGTMKNAFCQYRNMCLFGQKPVGKPVRGDGIALVTPFV